MKAYITILRYLDVFGTKFTSYTEQNPKLYTITGGILSIISILVCITSFFFLSFDDLNRKNPITTTSFMPSEGYRNVKIDDEKIWIPWRIIDYDNNEYVNHTGLLYPIIYYYKGIKDKKTKKFISNTTILNYKLCSETSMANKSDIYQITVPLDEIYCIETENLFIGGSWLDDFINYIEFDLYYCEGGIDYDKNNPKCSSFENIINYNGDYNSLDIAIYYPIVQFQPTNKTYPVIIIYRQFFYHLSKHSNKIDRLYIQENVLTDDSGWILKKESNYSYWGLNSINDDTYFIGENSDLMKEGSSSRAYSFNIYLEPGIIHYKRYYKKLYIIFSDFFPLAYIIFIIMKNISKIFTQAESNKNMVELLFENLKEKSIYDTNINKLIKQTVNCGKFSYKNLIRGKDNKINIFKNQQLNEGIQNNKIHQNSSSLILNIQNLNINSNNISNPNNPYIKNIIQKKSNQNSLFKDNINNNSSQKSNNKSVQIYKEDK